MSTYANAGTENANFLGKTHDYLLTTVKSKANVCLICIETIKKNDPVSMTACNTPWTVITVYLVEKNR